MTPAPRTGRCPPRSRSAGRWNSCSRAGCTRDHRLPRALHHRAAAARRVPRRPEGGAAVRPGARGGEGHDRDLRRRAARQPRAEPVASPARTGDRLHVVLAACELDGSPHRQRAHVAVLDRTLQRPDPPRLRPVPEQLRARVPAPAVAGRGDRLVGARAAPVRRGDGLRRLQRQPRPVGWHVERADARRPRQSGRCTRRCASSTCRR